MLTFVNAYCATMEMIMYGFLLMFINLMDYINVFKDKPELDSR